MGKYAKAALAAVAMSLPLWGCGGAPESSGPGQVVGMRRLTEAQYRNSIADIFGPDIVVAGRFAPIIRPMHDLISTGAAESAISPVGLEQFDAIARGITAQVFDAAHRGEFTPCTPADETQPDDACAEETLAPIGRYVFRRPLADEERGAFVQMAHDAAEDAGSFYKGLELSLAAMLVSPQFLYIIETAHPDPNNSGMLRLDNYSRAARLSFLLWNSTPNDALLEAAENGDLTNQRRLEAMAETMLASPRLKDGVRAFFSDMLVYEKFEELGKDPILYPHFNGAVASDLPEQILRTIVSHLVEENADYRALFTTRKTYITRPLGPIYNVPVRAMTGWQPLELAEDSNRAGIVGQAGFLALYSHPGRSSPTLRGSAVRELLLCQEVPDPPGNVDFDVVVNTDNPDLPTARDRLTAHSTQPACKGCHQIMDPIGLTLEKYDALGAFRTKENGAEIDVSGEMDGADYVGLAGLGDQLAANPATTQCAANRALEYAKGRPIEDPNLVGEAEKAFAAEGYRFQALLRWAAVAPNMYQVQAATADQERHAAISSRE